MTVVSVLSLHIFKKCSETHDANDDHIDTSTHFNATLYIEIRLRQTVPYLDSCRRILRLVLPP